MIDMIENLKYILPVWGFYSMSFDFLLKKESKIAEYYCLKCFTFWFTLLITFDIFSASLNALVAFYIDKINDRL